MRRNKGRERHIRIQRQTGIPQTQYQPGAQPIPSGIDVLRHAQPPSPGSAMYDMSPETVRTVFNAVFSDSVVHVGNIDNLQLFQSEPTRQFLSIQNRSTQSVYIGFSQKANAQTSYEIPPGATWTPAIAPIDTIWILGAQSGADQRVIGLQGLI